MQIDYTQTQLPDDELLELVERRKLDSEQEADKERLRQAKMRTFRFIGGMC